jgi:hypothetical protein
MEAELMRAKKKIEELTEALNICVREKEELISRVYYYESMPKRR